MEIAHVSSLDSSRSDLIFAYENYNAGEDESGRKSPQVLIATYKVLGTGLNLVRTKEIILAEPPDTAADETQAIGRALRIGQLHASVSVYHLYWKRYKVEAVVVARAKLRSSMHLAIGGGTRSIGSMPFVMPRSVMDIFTKEDA